MPLQQMGCPQEITLPLMENSELNQLKVGGGQGGSPDTQLEVMLEIDP